ncbi:MAG: glycosyltransferase family 39 protein [Phycisphaerales bacterium]|nr:glycosyltransferase family 39 protein [Hyphomonadaceae bacterium]
MTAARAAFDRATLAFLAVLIVLTATRIWALFESPLGLYFDEAQYWMWSRSFDWGYFTKPPMVAWVIGATTTLAGTDAEWAVRLGAPLAHAVAAGGVYALTRNMYGAWPGFWAGLGWLMLPGVFFSSSLISTDAVLLPLWTVALYAMWRMIDTRAMHWAIVIGVFLGLGVLAKYAMLYFVVCTAFAAWRMEIVRQALAGGRGWVAGLIAALIVTPNIVWNVNNGFATARHTASNASLNLDDMFHFDELFEFIGGQAGVLGPIIFFAVIWAIWRAIGRRDALSNEDKFLLAYILPPFIFISLIAFISRANANWAAVAYPAIVVWITGTLFSSVNGRRWLAGASAVNAALGVAFAIVVLSMPAIANQAKGIHTAQAWEQTAREVMSRAVTQPGEAPFTAVLVDDRATYFELNYYWRHARRAGAPLPPVRMWLLQAEAHNSAEASDPMRAEEGGRVLVVHLQRSYLPFVAGDFTVFRTVEHLTVPLGGGVNRELEISVGEGFAPAPRDAAFQERLNTRNEP